MSFFKGWFRKATESKETKVQRDLNQAACTACLENDFKQALELFAQGADPNHIGFRWEYTYDDKYKVSITPAYDAVKHNNEKALLALIERGLNVNISLDSDGKPLLMHTIESNKEKLACILVEHGADMSFVRKDLETCKSLAEAFEMNELLGKMEARVNPSIESQQALTAMKPIQLKKGATP